MSLPPLALAAARPRDVSRSVVLIGFKPQGNLGLGYLAAILARFGYTVEVVDCEDPPDAILATIRRANPVLVGFSLIFQFYINRFGSLARYLRSNGVTCHFTVGGHFPSLSPAETLTLVPQFDSIVRFEGELTLLELVDILSLGGRWQAADGIAYRDGTRLVSNPLRPLLADIDQLPNPNPHHAVATVSILGRVYAQLVASRGCAKTCSFCSIHMFYRSALGKVVRTRRPSEVAREMRKLYDELGATVLAFQDDDFPMAGPVWHRWCRELLEEIANQDLVGRVVWKISCRADAVETGLLANMREAGLCHVYMGLESGSEEGLRSLHKQTTVDQNLRAIEILNELGIYFDFGFMLLEPASTFESIFENVRFLRQIVGDGSAPAEFCRMIPYDGTPIKEELRRSGRLRGNVLNPDYDFLDPRLEVFFEEVNEALIVTGWIMGVQALARQLKFAWFEFAIMEHFTPSLPGLAGYKKTLRQITRASNEVLFTTVEELADQCKSERTSPSVSKEDLSRQREESVERLVRERNAFVTANRQALLGALEAHA